MSEGWRLGFDASKLRHSEWGGVGSGGGVQMELWGLEEVQAMLKAYTGQQMQNLTRRALRAGAAVFRTAMRSAGNAGWPNRPKGFNKTRTRGHRNPVGVSVSPKSILSNIFEHGAGAHAIGAAGQFLYNNADPFVARGPVMHPGVSARPFIGPIFTSNEREAEAAIAKVFVESWSK